MTLEKFLSTLTEAKKQRLEDLGFTPEEFVDAYDEHSYDYETGNPAVYCGTYGKYNEGSLFGQWLDLSTFSDADEFFTYCQALHADEPDPELMMQDYENFPREMYDECMGAQQFESIKEYFELCERYDRDAVDAYANIFGCNDFDNFDDKYVGHWDSEEDFAEHIVWECYDLRNVPELVKYHIDYEAIARELFMCDYNYEDGYVFNNY